MNGNQHQRITEQIPAGQIKLIFFDIDGTLLNSQVKVPVNAAVEIRRLQKLGVATAIASGRPYFAAKPLINALSLDGAGLFYTGAMLYDPARQNSLHLATLAEQDALAIHHLSQQNQLHCEFYTEQYYLIRESTLFTQYHSRYLGIEPIERDPEEVIGKQAIVKAMIVVDEGNTEQCTALESIQEALPHLNYAVGHGADKPHLQFCSIVSPQACKQQAFERLLDFYQLEPEQVMSLGDADSDKVFLSKAGVGVAMGNASDDVKKVANFTTDHVDQDGLANALAQIN